MKKFNSTKDLNNVIQMTFILSIFEIYRNYYLSEQTNKLDIEISNS